MGHSEFTNVVCLFHGVKFGPIEILFISGKKRKLSNDRFQSVLNTGNRADSSICGSVFNKRNSRGFAPLTSIVYCIV